MHTPYIAEKDYRNLYASFQVHFGSRFLDVFVWRSVRGLYRNTGFPKKDYHGAYVAYPYHRRRGLFGEIHLAKWFKARHLAHEIEHFLLDWLIERLLNTENCIEGLIKLNEPTAWLAGEATRLFWIEWHKVEKKRKK